MEGRSRFFLCKNKGSTHLCTKMIKKNKTIAKGHQNGAVTNHQDQSITPQSLSTMNAVPNKPNNEIPTHPLAELLLIIF